MVFDYRLKGVWSQNHSSEPQGKRRGSAYQTSDERLHDLGQGREEENTQGQPGHAQLKHLKNPG